MVQQQQRLDAAFASLADPTRRGILERLGRGAASITELAEAFEMTLTGMKKHVHVLEEARLVTSQKRGRVRECRLGPHDLSAETRWIEAHRVRLVEQFDHLEQFLAHQTEEGHQGGRMSTEARRTSAERKKAMATKSKKSGNAVVVSAPAPRELRIERVFDAPRDRVWRAFTDPEQIAQWWGRGRKTIIERMEVRRGGHWRFVVQGVHGVQGFEGRYREVTPQDRIVWTFEWDGMPGHVCVETTQFEDLGNKTRVVSTDLFFTDEERDAALNSGMSEGVDDSYRALDKLLAGQA